MGESYSGGSDEAAGQESNPGDSDTRALFAQLLPEFDVDLLLRALRSETSGRAPEGATGVLRRDASPAEGELHRVRADLALGRSARMLQHSLSNPLTALLAEAQLLELEPLAEEQRTSVVRIIELARRVAGVVRRLDAP